MSRIYEPQESMEVFSFDDWSVNVDSSHGGGGGGASESHDPLILVDNIPSSLHPAVSMGMRRVSSCYFSVRSEGSGSVVDLLSLWDENDNTINTPCPDDREGARGTNSAAKMSDAESSSSPQGSSWTSSSSDLLYHDILMNVFTFLDAPSLSALSETARRLNFEVFYFLQLQLQRALIPGTRASDDDLASIAGVSIVQRLANWNRAEAEGLVQEFLDSNASLRYMPLSHSLAYMRQVFQNNAKFPASPSSQTLASAALLVTLLGAASSFQMPEMSISSEMMSNMVFRLGFVGSIMGAMREPERLRERAEQMKQKAAAVMAGPHFPSWSELMRAFRNAETAAPNPSSSFFLLSHDPYAHVLTTTTAKATNAEEREGENTTTTTTTTLTTPPKTPTGCIGAYLRTVHRATGCIAQRVRESRRQRFLQFSAAEQQVLAQRFLEACTSNDSLAEVKAIVNNGVDVDGFYVGVDGSETCALHTAAFNGAARVIEFLCSGIDDESDNTGDGSNNNDGGLCDVNCRDANAWSALHFAAGSNSVEAVRVLVKHGADCSVEANNGYTPYQWAIRLKHHQVAQELKELASQDHLRNHRWMAHRPLSAIASRFFTFVMVQSN